MSTQTSSSRPVYRKKLPAGISFSVFENIREGVPTKSISLQRSFRQNGQWTNRSIYLDKKDIPLIQEALQDLLTYLDNPGLIPTDESEVTDTWEA